MQTEIMLKSNACLVQKYKENYENLKKKYDEIYQKNAKYERINQEFYKIKVKLRQENSNVISELIRLRKKIRGVKNKNKELELKISHLRKLISRKKMKGIVIVVADF